MIALADKNKIAIIAVPDLIEGLDGSD
jgi:hypothetical protein